MTGPTSLLSRVSIATRLIALSVILVAIMLGTALYSPARSIAPPTPRCSPNAWSR